MSPTSPIQATNTVTAITVPAPKAGSSKDEMVAMTKDAGRVHVGGSMMRF